MPLLSTIKVLNRLKEKGWITKWVLEKHDASFNGDGSRMEKRIHVEGNSILHVGNEIYGDKAMLYFYADSPENAQIVAKELMAMGGNPSFRWCSTRPDRFDMQVSYFKGNRWWE